MPAQLNGPAKNVAISTHSEYEAAANGKARSSEPNDSAARLIVYTYASVLQIEHAFISFCSARIIFKQCQCQPPNLNLNTHYAGVRTKC